ncbi:MAG: hypothetical protein R3E32_20535 [Chitinophagales bacterium]
MAKTPWSTIKGGLGQEGTILATKASQLPAIGPHCTMSINSLPAQFLVRYIINKSQPGKLGADIVICTSGLHGVLSQSSLQPSCAYMDKKEKHKNEKKIKRTLVTNLKV